MSLRIKHDEVHDGDREHILVERETGGGGGRRVRGVDDVARGGHGSVGREGGVGRGVFEGEFGCEFTVYRTREAYTIQNNQLER